MNWTSLFLKTNKLKVFILGTGEVATRRANRFLDNGSKVVLAGNSISKELEEKGGILTSTDNIDKYVKWADLVIIASGNKELSDYTTEIAENKLVNRADFPEKGNVIVPSSFNIGDVEISIFTNGKSPLMAKELRKKIQNIITEEDILQIELQDYSRSLLKDKVINQRDRKNYLYEILNDSQVKKLLKERKINEAKKYIKDLIELN